MYSIELDMHDGSTPRLLGETEDLQQARGCMMGAYFALDAAGVPAPWVVTIRGGDGSFEYRGRNEYDSIEAGRDGL